MSSPHSLIKSNQVLPLGVGPEPKSTSPCQALVQICYSSPQPHFRDSPPSGCSQQRANPSESVLQPHDELCVLLSYYLVFSFELMAILRDIRVNYMNLKKLAGEQKRGLRESISVAGLKGDFAVISWSPTMKWPTNSIFTTGVNK